MAKKCLFGLSLVAVLAMLVTSFASVFITAPAAVDASSHREAPMTSQDPTIDATDLYAFVSPERPDSLTFVMNYIPDQSPDSGPNFHRFGDDVLYQLHVDNNGDAQEDIAYLFTFKTLIVNPNTFLHNSYNGRPVGEVMDAEYNLRQYMYITRLDAPKDGSCKDQMLANCATAARAEIARDKEVAPANVGPKSFPVYPLTAAKVVHDLGAQFGNAKVFAGPRSDPFFVDLGALFDVLTIRKLPGNAGGGVNHLAGKNVHTIALQTPIRRFTSDGSTPTDPNAAAAVIGTWTTASRRSTKVIADLKTPTHTGPWVQVSRLGMPLVNEVVVPLGLKDTFNNLKPFQDGAIPPALVTDPELAKLFNALYGIKVPAAGRTDILMVYLQGVKGLNQPANVVPSEQLRLNVAIKPVATDKENRMGVLGGDLAGFPNGRRLKDDVVDISLRVVAGILIPEFGAMSPNKDLGDGVDRPARSAEITGTFPYMALPYNGFFNQTSQEEELKDDGTDGTVTGNRGNN